ncbi:MAG: hypothetical protein IT196_27790 [Acidimicrobiales bacterium]|nr:hypothetical protein [Acidimicrobiales bacterium]
MPGTSPGRHALAIENRPHAGDVREVRTGKIWELMSARHVGLRRFASLFALALLAPSIALIATVSSVGAATPAGPFTVDLTNREE